MCRWLKPVIIAYVFLNKNVFYKFGEMWIVEKNMSFVNT